MNIRFWKYIE